MSEIFESMPEYTLEGMEQVQQPTDQLVTEVNKTMQEASRSNDLTSSDESWLKSLFERIVEPIVDIFDGDEGCDTERITPVEQVRTQEEIMDAYDVDEAVEEWHVQEGDYSCAVCAQQFIINEFTDLDVTEEQLCTIAEANNWFDPECGTAPQDVGNLLEVFGIDTHTNYEGTIADIKQTLDQDGRVIAAVDSMVLAIDGYGNYPVSGADHVVEVIGIDDSDPGDVRVIINDSGMEGGGGRSVPYHEFMEAWMPSGGFMVSALPNG